MFYLELDHKINPLWNFRISFASGGLPTGGRWNLWHNEKSSIAEMGETSIWLISEGFASVAFYQILLIDFCPDPSLWPWNSLIVTACVIWDSYTSKWNVFIDRHIRTLNMGCFHLKNTLIRNQKEISVPVRILNSKQYRSQTLGAQVRLLILDYFEWKTSNWLLIFSKSNVSNCTVPLTFLRCKCNNGRAL